MRKSFKLIDLLLNLVTPSFRLSWHQHLVNSFLFSWYDFKMPFRKVELKIFSDSFPGTFQIEFSTTVTCWGIFRRIVDLTLARTASCFSFSSSLMPAVASMYNGVSWLSQNMKNFFLKYSEIFQIVKQVLLCVFLLVCCRWQMWVVVSGIQMHCQELRPC